MGRALGVEPALHDLDAVQVRPDRVTQGIDHEGGRIALRAVQVAAHRYALLVAAERGLAAVQVGVGELPAAEEPHHHARAGGGIDLLALHRVPDRGAGVLLRPDRGVTGRDQLVALEHAVLGLGERVVHALRLGLGIGRLAEEVVLLRRGQRGVRVGRTDHAELVGVGAQPAFQQQAVLQRLAGVFGGEHRLRLGLRQVQVARVPGLVVGEGVVGRQERMRLAVALDLGDLVHRLPLRALLDIGLVDGAAGILRVDREHDPVRQVAVMRQRQRAAPGLFLVGFQPLVQVQRVGRAYRRLGRVGHHLPRLLRALAEDHVAVQVVARHERGPFEPDQRGEPARVVVAFRRIDDLFPDRSIGAPAGRVFRQHLGVDPPLREGRDQIERRRGRGRAPRLQSLVPGPRLVELQDVRLARRQVVEEPHRVGMVGDHQPVQRPPQPGGLPAGGHDLLAAREAIGIVQPQPRAEQAGIDRQAGVQVRVAPQNLVGKTALGVWRIDLAAVKPRQGLLGRHELGQCGGCGNQGGTKQQGYQRVAGHGCSSSNGHDAFSLASPAPAREGNPPPRGGDLSSRTAPQALRPRVRPCRASHARGRIRPSRAPWRWNRASHAPPAAREPARPRRTARSPRASACPPRCRRSTR